MTRLKMKILAIVSHVFEQPLTLNLDFESGFGKAVPTPLGTMVNHEIWFIGLVYLRGHRYIWMWMDGSW